LRAGALRHWILQAGTLWHYILHAVHILLAGALRHWILQAGTLWHYILHAVHILRAGALRQYIQYYTLYINGQEDGTVYYRQEHVLSESPIFFDPLANIIGTSLIKYVNEYANRLNNFPIYDQSLQVSLSNSVDR
jgi:hypothetical protein